MLARMAASLNSNKAGGRSGLIAAPLIWLSIAVWLLEELNKEAYEGIAHDR